MVNRPPSRSPSKYSAYVGVRISYTTERRKRRKRRKTKWRSRRRRRRRGRKEETVVVCGVIPSHSHHAPVIPAPSFSCLVCSSSSYSNHLSPSCLLILQPACIFFYRSGPSSSFRPHPPTPTVFLLMFLFLLPSPPLVLVLVLLISSSSIDTGLNSGDRSI